MEEERKEGRRKEEKSGILKKGQVYWVLGGQGEEGEVP